MPTETQSTHLSSKGQLVIPRKMREALNWQPGTTLHITQVGQAVMIQPVAKPAGHRLQSLRGCLKSAVKLSDSALYEPVDLNNKR